MMRRRIFVILIALTLTGAVPARSQVSSGPGIAVFDLAQATNILKSIGIESDQLTQLVLTVEEVWQVYQEAILIYNSVNELVRADSWAGSLLNSAIRNPLPFAALDHPGWVGGFNDPSSLPFGSYYMGANTVGGNINAFKDGTFVGNEIVKTIRSFSTMQALASNNVLSIENRIIGLADLFEKLGTVGTIQQTDSLSARLHSEANYAHSQQVQSQNLKAAADQQIAVLKHNQQQYQYLDESNGVSFGCQTLAAGPNALSIAECTGAGAGGVGGLASGR